MRSQKWSSVIGVLSPRQWAACGDAVCILLTLGCTAVLRFGPFEGAAFLIDQGPRIAISLSAFLFSFYWFDLYELGKRQTVRSRFAPILKAVFMGTVADTLLQYGFFVIPIGRSLSFLKLFILTPLMLAWRVAFEEAMRLRLHVQNALIVGTGAEARSAFQLIRKEKRTGFRVVGFVSTQPQRPGTLEGEPVFSDGGDFLDAVVRRNIRVVILSTEGDDALSRRASLGLLASLQRNIELLTVPLLYERLTGRVPCRLASMEWLIQSMIGKTFQRTLKLKRIMDVLIAGLILLLLAPLYALIALGILVTSGRPVIFSQERIGKNMRPFRIYKFRTMSLQHSDGNGRRERSRKRITTLGRFLRHWHLDELPQLVNVVRGEMSLVGPRPEMPVFVKRMEEHLSLYNQRHAIPPGLTGWAQIKYLHCSSLQGYLKKFEYDLYYLKNMSLALDVLILVETLRLVSNSRWPSKVQTVRVKVAKSEPLIKVSKQWRM